MTNDFFFKGSAGKRIENAFSKDGIELKQKLLCLCSFLHTGLADIVLIEMLSTIKSLKLKKNYGEKILGPYSH
jgi:hypothetical protein